jgi:transposase InsO family protein
MRAAGIAGYVKKRKVRTTGPEPADQLVPDLLKRDFTADAPNRRYVGDITYLPLAEAAGGHNLYLATVIDCYSRRLVGWAMADLGVTQSMGAVLGRQRTRRVVRSLTRFSGHGWCGDHAAPLAVV